MNQNQDAAAVAAAALLGVVCLLLVVTIVIAILYLLTLQKALSRVAPRHRFMEPGLVWLSLIPFFNIVWAFFIATRVPDSLRNEFRDRGRDDGSDYAKSIGLAKAILGAVSYPLNVLSRMTKEPALVIFMGFLALLSLVLFIIFWVRIAGYSRELAALPYNFERVPDGHDDRDSEAIRPADPGMFRPEDRDRH